MKTAMKKVLSMALVLVLLLSVFPMSAFAAEVGVDGQSKAPQWPGFPGQGEQGGWPGFDQGENNWWPSFPQPDNGEDEEEDEEPAAPTSLTANFYLDTKLVETYTVETEITVQSLIENYCKVDKTTTVNYDGAKVNGDLVELTATIKLGQEVNIYLVTPVQPEPTPEPTPVPCTVCGQEAHEGDCCADCKELGHVADKCPNTMCPDCYLNKSDCVCGQTTAPESHWGEIKFTPMFRDDRGLFYKMDPVYVKMNATMGDVFAKIAIPANYNFQYWSWDAKGEEAINSYDRLPHGTNFVIYAQMAKQVQTVDGVDVYVNLNYNWKMGDTLENVAVGTRMGDVIKNIPTPIRWGYKFAGWYWDAECKNAVSNDNRVPFYKDAKIVIFAKWEEEDFQHETMLKIYINGDTRNVAKIVDLHTYANDGWITLDEVKEAVSKYYTAKNSDGLSYRGLYDPANWNSYLRNYWHAGEKILAVNKFDDTTIYVMVTNAKVRSSANADTTNPKTGDMIMTPVIVLGASAACLATLFYLNKKRSV